MTTTVTGPRLTSRRYGKSGHGYTLDGTKVDGATTILNALPGPPPSWGAEMAANLAVNEWDELAELAPTERLKRLKAAPDDFRDTAAARGTEIHAYGEKLAQDSSADVPDEIRGPVEAYARFLDAWEIEPIATETPVCHTLHRYGGTADLWGYIGARGSARALIDLKSGRTVQGKTVMQLAAYRYAELWQPDGPDSEEPLPPVDLVYVAHILPDDVRMLPVECGPEQLRAFLYVQQTARWMQRHDWWQRRPGDEPLIGEAERP